MDLSRITYRPTLLHTALAGAAIAMISGMLVGGYFKAGDRLEGPSPQNGLMTLGEAAAEPISFMTDAAGHIPDYVLGVDYVTPKGGFAPFEQSAWAEAPMSYEAPQPEPSPAYEPAAWSAPPPPSMGGDILAMAHREVAEEASVAAQVAAKDVALEDGSDPAAFRPVRREPVADSQTVIAAAY